MKLALGPIFSATLLLGNVSAREIYVKQGDTCKTVHEFIVNECKKVKGDECEVNRGLVECSTRYNDGFSGYYEKDEYVPAARYEYDCGLNSVVLELIK